MFPIYNINNKTIGKAVLFVFYICFIPSFILHCVGKGTVFEFCVLAIIGTVLDTEYIKENQMGNKKALIRYKVRISEKLKVSYFVNHWIKRKKSLTCETTIFIIL